MAKATRKEGIGATVKFKAPKKTKSPKTRKRNATPRKKTGR